MEDVEWHGYSLCRGELKYSQVVSIQLSSNRTSKCEQESRYTRQQLKTV